MTFDLILIDILVFQVVLLVLEITEDLVIGDRGKRNEVANYLREVRGEDIQIKKSRWSNLYDKLSGEYMISKKAIYGYMVLGFIFVYSFGLLFFRNQITALLFAGTGLLLPKYIVNSRRKRRQAILNRQLKEALQSIANSLRAGASLVTSVIRCLDDLKRVLVNEKDKPMVDELEKVVYQIRMGLPLEEALIQFRERVDLEDVRDFVNATLITKAKGGNMAHVMNEVAQTIGEKITIQQEIMVLTAGKRSEAKLLTFAPIGIVLLLALTSPKYMEPMYNTIYGQILLIIGIILLAINFYIGKKIMDIKI